MVKKSRRRHLLIIRLSAMGDVAMVVYAVRALRSSYPDLQITILTRPLFEPLFSGLGVDVLACDTKGRHKGVIGIARLAREVAALGVDCVADLHSVMRSAILRTFLNLYGIGSMRLHKSHLRKWMRMDGGCNGATIPLKHTVIRYCDVLRKLGFEFDDPTPATKVARPNPMPYDKGSERWVGIAPFSAHEGKSYPLHLVRTVIEELSKRYDRIFIHSGGGAELAFAEDIESNISNVVAVFSKVNLAEEIDLISNLDCIITMDSFAMHVASLTATPSISIWGATHPSLGFSGYGTTSDDYLQLDLPCRPCSTFGNKRCRFGDYHCLNDIDPIAVVERVERVLPQ